MRHGSQGVRKTRNQFCHMMDQRLKTQPSYLRQLRQYQYRVLTAALATGQLITLETVRTTLNCSDKMACWVERRLLQDGYVASGVPTQTGRELTI